MTNVITKHDKQMILNYHNTARHQVGSPPLIWDTALENAAMECLRQKQPTEMEHGICDDIPALSDVGENLALGTNVLERL